MLHAHAKTYEELWLEQRVVLRSLSWTQPLINHSFHPNHTIHMQIKQHLQSKPKPLKVIYFYIKPKALQPKQELIAMPQYYNYNINYIT